MKNSIVLLICGFFLLAAALISCKKESLPTLTTVPVTQVTTISALSGGDISTDGGTTVTSRGVCWNTSPNPTVSDAHTIDSNGKGEYASTITGLTPETTYYIRAYANNAVGTAYGQEISFKTLEQSGKFNDVRDNREYQWIRIGEQVWMAENLAYLPSVSPSTEGTSTELYYYVYGYQGSEVSEAKAMDNYSIYGVLYNWPAAMNACPVGWHLPTDLEWSQLTDYLGGQENAGGKLKEIGTTHWNSPNTDATNESNFTALPGGQRIAGSPFSYIGESGKWWSASETSTTNAWNRSLSNSSNKVYRTSIPRRYGNSVRCIRD